MNSVTMTTSDYREMQVTVLYAGVLPKSVNPRHIKENAEIFDFQLSEDQMSRLSSINSNVHYCWDPTSVL